MTDLANIIKTASRARALSILKGLSIAMTATSMVDKESDAAKKARAEYIRAGAAYCKRLVVTHGITAQEAADMLAAQIEKAVRSAHAAVLRMLGYKPFTE